MENPEERFELHMKLPLGEQGWALLEEFREMPYKTEKMCQKYRNILISMLKNPEEQNIIDVVLQKWKSYDKTEGIRRFPHDQHIANFRYIIMKRRGVRLGENRDMQRKKVLGGCVHEDGTYKWYDPIDNHKLEELGIPSYMRRQIYTSLADVFPELIESPDEFPSSRDIAIDRLRYQLITERGINPCGDPVQERKKITGGVVGTRMMFDGKETTIFGYADQITPSTLVSLGYSSVIYNSTRKSLRNAFPELITAQDHYPLLEDLRIERLKYQLICERGVDPYGEPNIQRRKLLGGVFESILMCGDRKLSVFGHIDPINAEYLESLGYGYLSKNRKKLLMKIFPELLASRDSYPSLRDTVIQELRYQLVISRDIDVYGDSSLEKQKLIGNEQYPTVTRTLCRELIGRYFPNYDVLELLSDVFPEFSFSAEDFRKKHRPQKYAWSNMSAEDIIAVYRHVISSEMSIPASPPSEGSDEWYDIIRRLIPPNITFQRMKTHGLNTSRIYDLSKSYSAFIIDAFPEYHLKSVMYGKKGGWRDKSKTPNFFAEALGKDLDTTEHHTIYNMIKSSPEKGKELLVTYIRGNHKFVFKQFNESKISSIFWKLYQMIEGLDEMVHHYSLDALIKGASSWAVQTEKRTNFKKLRSSVGNQYDKGEDDALSREKYSKNPRTYESYHSNETIIEKQQWEQVYSYLESLPENDPLHIGFHKVLNRLQGMNKKELQMLQQEEIIDRLEQESGMKIGQLLALLDRQSVEDGVLLELI